jgi:hypothetical protein
MLALLIAGLLHHSTPANTITVQHRVYRVCSAATHCPHILHRPTTCHNDGPVQSPGRVYRPMTASRVACPLTSTSR